MNSTYSLKQMMATLLMAWLGLTTQGTTAFAQRSLEPPPDDGMPPPRHNGDRGAFPDGGPERPGFRGGPRRGQGRPGESRRPGWQRMNQKEKEQLHRFAQEHFPRLYEELQRAKDKHPERYQQRMRRMMPELRHLMELSKTHPERAALSIRERRCDMSMRRLARKYRRTEDEAKRQTLRAEIHELATKSFECRHNRRALEISAFETRLEELKERHEEANEMRSRIIRRMVEDRLSERGPKGERGPQGEWNQRQRPDRDRRGPNQDRQGARQRRRPAETD